MARPNPQLALVLPALHAALCLALGTGLLEVEGSWEWFFVFLVDLPFSILLLFLQDFADPVLVFGILGTAWWYGVSRFVLYLWGRAESEVRRQRLTLDDPKG